MRLRNDIVLVMLAPNPETQKTAGGLYIAPAMVPATTYGKVRDVGPLVVDVKKGDMVAFPAEAGEPVNILNYDHLLIREEAISAVIEKHEVA